MAFTGTYEVESRENLDAFLKATGGSADEIAAVKAMKMVQNIKQDGNTFTVEKVLPKKTFSNTFTVGQPTTITNMRGKNIENAVVSMEGGQLIAKKGDFCQESWIDGGKLVETITFNGVTMKRVSAKK